MQRRMRIAAVMAGLVVAGGIFGTIAGTIVLLAWLAGTGGLSPISDSLVFSLFFGVVFGGGLGAVVGPLAAWVLMRHVPLWLAVGGTTLATCASGGLVILITGSPGFAITVGLVGFMMSATALNDRFTGDEQPRLGS